MIKDKITKQEGGDKSTNLQGHSIVINQGISYQDAKEIANDVFKSNYLELSSRAAETAKARAEELVDDFLKAVEDRNPEAIKTMEEPGMQHAIFSAQKEYARTGDKNLSDMLVDILVDRAAQTERNLKQIVLDESLNVVPKLTNSQLDTLTVAFILKYSRNYNINNLETFRKYLETYLKPFASSLSRENSLYQHLEFTGCAAISIGSSQIENILSQTYKGIFCKGFTKEEFEKNQRDFEKFQALIIPCLQDKYKFQLNAIDDETLEQKAKELKFTDFDIITLKPFMNSHQMDHKELKDIMKEQGDFMDSILDVWDNSSLKSMTLTSVGIAIAQANLRRKTGITVDLGIWIK